MFGGQTLVGQVVPTNVCGHGVPYLAIVLYACVATAIFATFELSRSADVRWSYMSVKKSADPALLWPLYLLPFIVAAFLIACNKLIERCKNHR